MLDPYEPPVHHIEHPSEPVGPFNFFHPSYKVEGWEATSFFTMFVGVVMACCVGYTNTDPDHDYRAWARREALTRMKIKEEGGEVEFGKWYSSLREQEAPTFDHVWSDEKK